MKPDPDKVLHSVKRMMLSHHPPMHNDRTILLCLGCHKFRLCSRCMGLLIGFITVFLLAKVIILQVLDRYYVAWFILFCPLPAIIDFHGQLMSIWKSTNLRRIFSGFILGAGISLSLLRFFSGHYLFFIVIPCVIGLYFMWIALNWQRINCLLRHLRMYEDYYETCCCEDARRAVSRMQIKQSL